MTGHRAIGVYIILFSTICEAAGQLAFKRAAGSKTATGGALHSALVNYRWVLLGWVCFMCEGVCWSAALYFLDLSVAHPLGSLVFVVVAVLSRLFLGEKVTGRRWVGITLILLGTVVVALN